MKVLRNIFSDSGSDCRYWRIPSSEFRFCIEGAGPSSTVSLSVQVVFSSVSRWELTNVWGLCCLTPRGIVELKIKV